MNNYSSYGNLSDDPNGHKSNRQIKEEISILEEKIARNKERMQSLFLKEKAWLENQIDEDDMRLSALYYVIKRRQLERFFSYIFGLVVLLFLFFVWLKLGAPAPFKDKVSNKISIDEESVVGKLLSDSYYNPEYVIEGVVENNNNYSVSNVSIEYTTYDKQGFQLGTCSVYLSLLEPKKKQKFRVKCMDFPTKIATYQLTKLLGH